MKVKEEVVFLSGQGNHQLGSEILKELTELFGQPCEFDHINFNLYPDGEKDDRIVRYDKIKDKIVVFYQSVNDQERLDETIDLIWGIKHQYGAKYIIGIFPFLSNRRQDPMMYEEERDELSLKKPLKPDEIKRLEKTIHLLKTCGVDEMLVTTPHSNAMEKYCNKYNIKFHEIDVSVFFSSRILTFVPEEDHKYIIAYSPDVGSIKRAIKLARLLHCPVFFNEKNRPLYNTVSVIETSKEERDCLTNELRKFYEFEDLHYATQELVTGKVIVMVEDEVASGSTANKTACALKGYNPSMILFFATHAVLTPGWRNLLFQNNPFTKIIMTDTIHRGYNKRTGGKITDISVGPLFGASLFQILNRM